MELNIADIFEAMAAAYPEREALLFRDRRLTYGAVADRSRRLSGALGNAGIGRRRDDEPEHGWESPHDHVALYLYNGNEYLESMLASYLARAAPVNVNYRYRADELVHLLNDSAAAALVFHSCFAPTVAAIRDRLPSLRWLCQVADGSGERLLAGAHWYEDAVAGDPPGQLPRRSGSDRYVCYTGGTTGSPKGVLWRQADFLVAGLGVTRRDGTDVDSLDEIVDAAADTRLRALPTPPLMHGAAQWNALAAWASGGTVILQSEPTHLDAHDVWSTVERHRATSILLVGDSFAVPLLDRLSEHSYDLTSLRHVISGGAVLSPTVRERLLGALGGVTIVDVLGSSESGRQGMARVVGAGRTDIGFRPAVSAAIMSEDRTHLLGVDDTHPGWLVQTGRVPLGYLGDPEKSAATFPEIDGRRCAIAGDRARYGPDGEIVLLGRDSVCINTGGEKVFAEEVEVALTSHTAVRDAIVCGRPSTRWGQEVVAVVQVEHGASVGDDELVEHCRSRLASFKAPRALFRVDAVLRSPSGKADYAWARRVVEGSTRR